MTRKRFVKLLMSKGYTRNGAEAAAAFVRAKKESYATGYKAVALSKSVVATALPHIAEACAEAMKAFGLMAKAVSAAVEAFGKAYTETMQKERELEQ